MDCCGGGVWNTHRAVMKIRCWWRNIRYNNQYKYNKSCRWNRIIYFVHGEFVPKKSREKWNAVSLGILFDYTAILWAHPVHILLHHNEYQQLVQWSVSRTQCRERSSFSIGQCFNWEDTNFLSKGPLCTGSAQSPKSRHENHYATSPHKHSARAHHTRTSFSYTHHVMV